MNLDKSKNILIVGLGLLGGSYARILSEKGFNVSAITKEQSSVDFALNEKIVKYATVSVEEDIVKSADVIIFALYPGTFVKWIEEYAHLIKKGAVITDVTGVKGTVVDKIQSLLNNDVEFIAAHPMAGKEVSGIENSDDKLFNDANYIVVPTKKNTEKGIEFCKNLGRLLGFKRISVLSVSEHDRMIAFLSQLTHCIAVSLMCSNDSENLVSYTGDSFRDLTRIAIINEKMWTELFLMNKKQLMSSMESFRNSFDKLYNAIKENDTEKMKEMMKCSTERRTLFNRRG